jgi:hypothetical protein
MRMVDLRELILRKFKDIAGSRYEEIIKAYQEFFLTEEEMSIPTIASILFVLDRFSEKPSRELYEVLAAYPSATVRVVYIVDRGVYELIKDTLGENAAEEFREKEKSLAEKYLEEVSKALFELGMDFTTELTFEDKVEFSEREIKSHDLLVVSRHFGSETMKTHKVSPVTFRIVQRVEKPIIVY